MTRTRMGILVEPSRAVPPFYPDSKRSRISSLLRLQASPADRQDADHRRVRVSLLALAALTVQPDTTTSLRRHFLSIVSAVTHRATGQQVLERRWTCCSSCTPTTRHNCSANSMRAVGAVRSRSVLAPPAAAAAASLTDPLHGRRQRGSCDDRRISARSAHNPGRSSERPGGRAKRWGSAHASTRTTPACERWSEDLLRGSFEVTGPQPADRHRHRA